MVTESDKIATQSNGLIRSAYIVPGSEAWDGSSYTLTVRLKLYNVYTYLKKKKIYYK